MTVTKERAMQMFDRDLEILMDDLRGMQAHYQIADWEAFVFIRKPNCPESYVAKYAAADDGFAKQIVQLHATPTTPSDAAMRDWRWWDTYLRSIGYIDLANRMLAEFKPGWRWSEHCETPVAPVGVTKAAKEIHALCDELAPDIPNDSTSYAPRVEQIAAIITRHLAATVSDRETSMNTVTFGDSKNIANPDVSCPRCGGTKPTCCSCPEPKQFSLPEFAREFTQAAINAHVGFKHETRWHDCDYASCAKWRDMIDTLNTAAATTSLETPVGGETTLHKRLAELQKWQDDVVEREAAVCPEDIPFDEYIRHLEEKLKERENNA